MVTPSYIVRKIGDKYVALAQDCCPGIRGAYIGAGAAIALLGWRRGGVLGKLAIAAGSALSLRGLLGHSLLCNTKALDRAPDSCEDLAPSYQNDFPRRAPQLPADVVDEQSMESFPASDPPARAGVTLSR